MITVDQLEVLLRSVPVYFLFGGLSLYLFAWIEKKPKLGIWGELLFVVVGILALITLLSGMIPSPKTPGLVEEHVQMVIKMLTLLVLTGGLAVASILIRLIRKKHWIPIILAVFALSLFLFFTTTRLGKIKFQLNVPVQSELKQ